MKDKLKKVFKSEGFDYGDVRYEQNRETEVSYEKQELKEIKNSYREGGHLRLYNQGCKAVGSFSQIDEVPLVQQNLAEASKKGAEFKQEKARLKEAPVVNKQILTQPKDDPRDYSLQDKKDLVQKYNEMALQQENVINTRFSYHDFYSRRTFINSEGTEIEYDLLGCMLRGVIFARKGDVVQTKRISFGGYPEFSRLIDREDEIRESLEVLQQMIEADPITAGSFPVVINPKLAAVFIHEAFGHLSEADLIENNPSFREKLQLGAELGRESLTVIDDPTLAGRPGHYHYDDEGQAGKRTVLIDKGILSGRLHSRETAASFSEPLTGNMRAVDCHYTPIIRMSNIFIDAGENTRQELINSIDDGYYLINGKGGQTTGDQFTFGAEYGYKIENGKKQKMVRDINISGELFSTLKRISMVGDDLSFNEVGGCGKGDPMQLNIFSGMGAPHIKVDQVNVGGK
ncbi:MAG: TldD/PmbA family protein [Bacillota bacterium]